MLFCGSPSPLFFFQRSKLIIGSPSTERVPAAVTLLSKAFETDPVITYFLSSLNPDERLGYIAAYFRSLLTAAALNGASFDEVGDWSCCAVWVPPGRHVDNPLTLF